MNEDCAAKVGESKGMCRNRETQASPISDTAQAAVSQTAKTQILKDKGKVRFELLPQHCSPLPFTSPLSYMFSKPRTSTNFVLMNKAFMSWI